MAIRLLQNFPLLLALLLLPLTPGRQAQALLRTYLVDPSQSRIEITLKQEGYISRRYPTHRVVVKEFKIKIEKPADESRLGVEVEANAKTLTNQDEAMSDFERKEFHHSLRTISLESEKYPTIKFLSVSIADLERSGNNRNFILSGDLTLHGVTKRISFPVKVTLTDDQLTAVGEAKIKQSDFSMKPFEKGLGLIKVADELKVNFNLKAKAQ